MTAPSLLATRRAVLDDLSDVGRAVEWAGHWMTEAKLPEDLRFGIEVCLEEALANLIVHGRAPEGDKEIAVEVSGDAAEAVVQITDRCVPYDVAHAAPPPHGRRARLVEGGRGLILIRSFASALSYETKDGGNRLTMSFRVVPSPGPSD